MRQALTAQRLHSTPVLGPPEVHLAPTRGVRRLPAIDAARGAAMVLVCLSHFATKYVAPAGSEAAGVRLRFASHIASPMFFIISGAMVGYLHASRPDDFMRVRAILAKRAVFLLTIGHALILGAQARRLGDVTGSARMLFVTDTIAIALLVTPRLLRIPARWRVIGAAAVCIGSCTAVYLWNPEGLLGRVVKDTLVGIDGRTFWTYDVPIIPWLCVHAAGTVLGARLAASTTSGARERLERYLASLGCGIIALALMLRRALLFLGTSVDAPHGRAAFALSQLASPWQRLPPSPAHLLLFSGLALVGISLVFSFESLAVFPRMLDWLGVLGKASAFVFIVQFYVFYAIIPILVPLRLVLAPAVFLAATLLIGESARFWLHHRATLTRPTWFTGTMSALWASRS